MYSTGTSGRINRTPSRISTANCFNTGIYQDIKIDDKVTLIEIRLTALEQYTSLANVRLLIGQGNAVFQEGALGQDSARTWLVPDDAGGFQFDYLDVRGSAHLGLLSSATINGSMTVGKLAGDHTGTLHVGAKQNIALTVPRTTILPFHVQTYKVRYPQRAHNVQCCILVEEKVAMLTT